MADVKRQLVVVEVDVDQALQVFELDFGSGLELVVAAEPFEKVIPLAEHLQGVPDAAGGEVGHGPGADPFRLGGAAQPFRLGQAQSRDPEHGVLVHLVAGQNEVAAHGLVVELDLDPVPDVGDVVVVPKLPGVGGGDAATFGAGTVVLFALVMVFDRIGRAVDDVDPSAVGFPTWRPHRIMIVGVGDSAIVLFLELVVRGVQIGVPAPPELFDEGVAFVVGGEILEDGEFFVGDDVHDVFFKPLFVVILRFLSTLPLGVVLSRLGMDRGGKTQAEKAGGRPSSRIPKHSSHDGLHYKQNGPRNRGGGWCEQAPDVDRLPDEARHGLRSGSVNGSSAASSLRFSWRAFSSRYLATSPLARSACPNCP